MCREVSVQGQAVRAWVGTPPRSARLDGSAPRLGPRIAAFSTPEEAFHYIQCRHPNSEVAARIVNVETGEIFNVEGYLVDTPRSPYLEEVLAAFAPPEGDLFPELQEQMRGEQQRFRATENARNRFVQQRRERERASMRRARSFNFTGGADGLEVGFSNPDPKKVKKVKYKVQWWKEGF
jgi:hypothetical protein